jgi:anti-sigma B factor antagonist
MFKPMTLSEIPSFTTTVSHDEDARVVVVAGEIDMVTAPEFARALESASVGSRRVVADLTEVGFFDSSGLAALVRAHRALTARGIELRVVVPPSALARRVLELTRLDELLHVDESRTAALS